MRHVTSKKGGTQVVEHSLSLAEKRVFVVRRARSPTNKAHAAMRPPCPLVVRLLLSNFKKKGQVELEICKGSQRHKGLLLVANLPTLACAPPANLFPPTRQARPNPLTTKPCHNATKHVTASRMSLLASKLSTPRLSTPATVISGPCKTGPQEKI